MVLTSCADYINLIGLSISRNYSIFYILTSWFYLFNRWFLSLVVCFQLQFVFPNMFTCCLSSIFTWCSQIVSLMPWKVMVPFVAWSFYPLRATGMLHERASCMFYGKPIGGFRNIVCQILLMQAQNLMPVRTRWAKELQTLITKQLLPVEEVGQSWQTLSMKDSTLYQGHYYGNFAIPISLLTKYSVH